MALKNHLFRNVIAPRDHASELHPLDASWAKGAMIRRAVMISHVPIIAMIPWRIYDIRSGEALFIRIYSDSIARVLGCQAASPRFSRG